LLSIPGEVRIPEAGWAISAERLGGLPDVARRGRRAEVLVQPEVGAELVVRSRRPGDAFRPVGVGGRKKLQDFFVDRKVPRPERDRVPIVVDGRNRIVWVVGQAVAEDFTVTAPAAGVILLKARRLGGPG
jgi:tRNA(Ile)-lysidine synthase